MLKSPLWQCPVCFFDAKEPTASCRRCGSYLLLLVKIKIEAQASILRVEEAKALFLNGYQHPSYKKEIGFLKRLRGLLQNRNKKK